MDLKLPQQFFTTIQQKNHFVEGIETNFNLYIWNLNKLLFCVLIKKQGRWNNWKIEYNLFQILFFDYYQIRCGDLLGISQKALKVTRIKMSSVR